MTIRSIGIIGAGTMGGGIAQVAATAGVSVTLLDVSDAIVNKAVERITASFGRLVTKGTLTSQAKDTALSLLKTSTQFEAMRDADIIIEAATENFELKSKIVKQIASVARSDAILATNTSSLSVTRLASLVAKPERFVGMHFFNPVPLMRLVEVVRGLQTSDQTVELVSTAAKQLGKTPIVARNMPGFVVNRLLLPMINEAFFLLETGTASPEEIDEGMKLGCNHPMGPLALADLIGLDVALAVTEVLHREFGDSKYRPSQRLKELVDAGYLGRKTGRGVYTY